MKKIDFISIEDFKRIYNIESVSVFNTKYGNYAVFKDDPRPCSADIDLDFKIPIFVKCTYYSEKGTVSYHLTNRNNNEQSIQDKSPEKVYITLANSIRILKNIEVLDIDIENEEIYHNRITFYSKHEIKNLLLIKNFYRNPDKFLSFVYKPVIKSDSLRFIHPDDKAPAYHKTSDCDSLLSDFKDFIVPDEIKKRATSYAQNNSLSDSQVEAFVTEKVNEFRRWFLQNQDLYINNVDVFVKKLEVRWNIFVRPEEIELLNSGSLEFKNYELDQLEKEIDLLIYKANTFFNENVDIQYIIEKFKCLTFLSYSEDRIRINDTHLSDNKLKKFLREYDEKFKKKTTNLLVEYYRVKYNPNLAFNGKLLDKLGFKRCLRCF